jgi:hypothetical protein
MCHIEAARAVVAGVHHMCNVVAKFRESSDTDPATLVAAYRNPSLWQFVLCINNQTTNRMRGVNASIAQLVAASRAKALPDSVEHKVR